MTDMLDYWLNKLFYDLHGDRELAAEYRADREAILSRYPLTEPVLNAIRNDDVAALANLTNPFLMRYYFIASGMAEVRFLDHLKSMLRSREAAHG